MNLCSGRAFCSSAVGSGAGIGSAYHWYIGADQCVRKVGDDEYQTFMSGLKFKVGHRRPHWRKWSYEYPEQKSKIIIIEETLNYLRDLIGEVEVAVFFFHHSYHDVVEVSFSVSLYDGGIHPSV